MRKEYFKNHIMGFIVYLFNYLIFDNHDALYRYLLRELENIISKGL